MLGKLWGPENSHRLIGMQKRLLPRKTDWPFLTKLNIFLTVRSSSHAIWFLPNIAKQRTTNKQTKSPHKPEHRCLLMLYSICIVVLSYSHTVEYYSALKGNASSSPRQAGPQVPSTSKKAHLKGGMLCKGSGDVLEILRTQCRMGQWGRWCVLQRASRSSLYFPSLQEL